MKHLCTLFMLALLVGAACRSSEPTAPSDTMVFFNATVIDGTGSAPRPNQAVVVRGERIAQVGPVDSVLIPPDALVLDLSGKFLLPGFVDLHVHFPEDASVHQAILDRLLEFGVTTILNPGARPGAGVALRERIRGGQLRGPRMFTAGRIIDHSPTGDGLETWAALVTTEAAMRKEVRAQVARGVDCIKLYRRLPPALVAAGIDEARELGLPVVGHMGATTWGKAAGQGIHMLVHSGWGTPMDEVVHLEDPEEASDTDWYHAYADAPNSMRFMSLVQSLLDQSVVVVPTLAITQAAGLGADANLLPRFQVELAPEADVPGWWDEGWRKRHPQYGADSEEEAELLATIYFPGVLAIHRAYFEHGVRLGVGTDVGNPWITPGAVFHYELELYQEAGIPPLEILKMATHNGAEALGILDDVGTVEVGKQADLLVLEEDPTLDIRHTRTLLAVYQAGRER